MNRLEELTDRTNGPTLLAFDFPFGYPAGSNLGGGRDAGAILAKLLQSDEQDSNNRFEVADLLNTRFGKTGGPFWGCPSAKLLPNLTPTKPPFNHTGFNEWRRVEHLLRGQGHRIMNVWQLLGQGSVGSQTLTGLAELYNFANSSSRKKPVRFWPFETHWDEELSDIVLAEVWPSLSKYDDIDHPIKDARQVRACLNSLWDHNTSGTIKSLFAAPAYLDTEVEQDVRMQEGWILGVTGSYAN